MYVVLDKDTVPTGTEVVQNLGRKCGERPWWVESDTSGSRTRGATFPRRTGSCSSMVSNAEKYDAEWTDRLEEHLSDAVHVMIETLGSEKKKTDPIRLVADHLRTFKSLPERETTLDNLRRVKREVYNKKGTPEKDKDKDEDAWNLQMWLGSSDLGPKVSGHIAEALKTVKEITRDNKNVKQDAASSTPKKVEGDDFDEQSFLDEIGKLDEDDAKAAIRHLLVSSDLMDNLVDLLHNKISSMMKTRASATTQVPSEENKYVQESVAGLTYGGISTFFKGLEGFLGMPSSNLMEAMEFEHTESADANADFQVTRGTAAAPRTIPISIPHPSQHLATCTDGACRCRRSTTTPRRRPRSNGCS